jgi:Right handed beta helix region
LPNVLKHKFTSPVSDGPNASLVRPSNWNDEHAFAGGSHGQLLYRDTTASDGVRWENGPVYRPEFFDGADLSAKINACVAGMPSDGGVIDARRFTGALTLCTPIVLSKPVTLLLGRATITSAVTPMIQVTGTGAGSGILGAPCAATILASTLTNQGILQINTDFPVALENLHISHTGAPKTAGYGIDVTAPGLGANGHSRFRNLIIAYQALGMHFRNSAGWTLRDSYIVNNSGVGIQIEGENEPDAGDSTIDGCIFDTDSNGVDVSAIRLLSSAGLRLINNKFLNHYYAFALDIQDSTSILLVQGNSFEHQRGVSISLSRTSGTALFSHVNITGNQFTGTYGPNIAINTAAVGSVVINGNLLSGAGAWNMINLNAGSDIVMMGNLFQGNGVARGIYIDTSVIRAVIGPNHFVACSPNNYLNYSASTVIWTQA